MNKIGVFYGSTTGTTEDVARRIAEKLNVPSAHIFEVSKLTEALVNEYDVLVLGSSTWGAGELQDDWYDGVNVLKKCDLSHKYVALFGCGDSDSYSDTFCDAIGIIYEDLKDTHCKFCGAVDTAGYTFDSSIAFNGTINTKQLLKQLVARTGYKPGVVEGTLMELVDLVGEYIGQGYRVEVGEFGYFSGKIKSRLVKDKKDLRSPSIQFNGVNFLASKTFKKKATGKLERAQKLFFQASSQLDDEELKRRLLEHVNRYGFITRTTYTELTGRLKNKALEDLKRFAKEGIICKVGRGNQMLFVKNQEDSQTEQNI